MLARIILRNDAQYGSHSYLVTMEPIQKKTLADRRTDRITNLDTIRGVAVLGILVMNAVSYGLPGAAYFNLSAAGAESWFDWVVGVFGEIAVDQKTMALFSMLFGAGIVLFADRAAMKNVDGTRLSLRRNLLLLGIGLLHGMVWEGDVLRVYAVCAPVLIVVRNRNSRSLLVAGSGLVLLSAVVAVVVQLGSDVTGGLGGYWELGPESLSDAVGVFLLTDFFARALGMMLIGVALYRMGIVQGERSPHFYRMMMRWGLGVGIPIAAAGVMLQAWFGFGPEISIIGEAPNTLATIPMTLGYLGAITLWNNREDSWLHRRIQAVGRMALTNYLSQTAIGVLLLPIALEHLGATRSVVALFVVVVWAIQIAWSTPWLDRFRFGPAEWVWRSLTYRKIQPIRH